jgi:hypothetical protein
MHTSVIDCSAFSCFTAVHFPVEDDESILVLNSLLLKVSVTAYDESIATDRQLSIIAVHTLSRFIVVSSSIPPKL